MSETAPTRSPTARQWCVLIFVAGLLLFAPTASYEFAYDDQLFIQSNLFVHHPQLFPLLWTRSYLGRPGGMGVGHMRPVVTTTYAVTWWLVGETPSVFHATNALLHALNGLLVFGLARRWLGSDRAAGAAALLFAIHPLHTEAVANVVGRAELLVVTFGLLAWRLHAGGKPTALRAGSAALLYLAALLSKANALPLVVLFAADDWLLGREGRRADPRGWWRGRALLFGAQAAALIAYFGIRLAVLGEFGTPLRDRWPFNPLSLEAWPARLPTALALLGFHWRLFAWPHPMRPDYSFNAYPLVESALDPRLWVALAVVAALVALAVWARRRSPGLSLAVLIYGLGVALTSNIALPIGHLFAERNLYLPSVGMVVLAGAAAAAVWRRWPRAVWVLGAVAAVLAVRTVAEARAWTDMRTLMERATVTTPGSTTVWTNLAWEWITDAALLPEGAPEREEALAQADSCLDQAREIWPENPGMHYAQSRVAWLRGDLRGAADLIDRAMERLVVSGQMAMDRLRLAEALGEGDEIEALVERILEMAPASEYALATKVELMLAAGRTQEALETARWLTVIQPHTREPWRLMGLACQAAGDAEGFEEARRRYEALEWVTRLPPQ